MPGVAVRAHCPGGARDFRNMPAQRVKRPPSAFQLFCNKHRSDVKAELGGRCRICARRGLR